MEHETLDARGTPPPPKKRWTRRLLTGLASAPFAALVVLAAAVSGGVGYALWTDAAIEAALPHARPRLSAAAARPVDIGRGIKLTTQQLRTALRPDWSPTGRRVSEDPEACFDATTRFTVSVDAGDGNCEEALVADLRTITTPSDFRIELALYERLQGDTFRSIDFGEIAGNGVLLRARRVPAFRLPTWRFDSPIDIADLAAAHPLKTLYPVNGGTPSRLSKADIERSLAAVFSGLGEATAGHLFGTPAVGTRSPSLQTLRAITGRLQIAIAFFGFAAIALAGALVIRRAFALDTPAGLSIFLRLEGVVTGLGLFGTTLGLLDAGKGGTPMTAIATGIGTTLLAVVFVLAAGLIYVLTLVVPTRCRAQRPSPSRIEVDAQRQTTMLDPAGGDAVDPPVPANPPKSVDGTPDPEIGRAPKSSRGDTPRRGVPRQPPVDVLERGLEIFVEHGRDALRSWRREHCYPAHWFAPRRRRSA
jgi:hypothetical protein